MNDAVHEILKDVDRQLVQLHVQLANARCDFTDDEARLLLAEAMRAVVDARARISDVFADAKGAV